MQQVKKAGISGSALLPLAKQCRGDVEELILAPSGQLLLASLLFISELFSWLHQYLRLNKSPVLLPDAAPFCLVVCLHQHHNYHHHFSRTQNGCNKEKNIKEEENNITGNKRSLAKVAPSLLLIFLLISRCYQKTNLHLMCYLLSVISGTLSEMGSDPK